MTRCAAVTLLVLAATTNHLAHALTLPRHLAPRTILQTTTRPHQQRHGPLQLKKKDAKTKDVQVVLTADVKGVGRAGELLTVKPAYAENFIVSKGLGKKATPEMLSEIAAENEAKRQQAVADRVAADADAKTIEAIFGKQGAFIKKKVGPDGSLFGSVTSADLAQIIGENAGVSVEKKDIEVPSISKMGSAVAKVKLHKEVEVAVRFNVISATL